MYVYQEGKLYVQSGAKLVWIEIYPDFTFSITDKSVARKTVAKNLSNAEVMAKFHLPNLLPIEPKKVMPKKPATRKKKVEVKTDESTSNAKRTTRKSTAK